MKRLRAGDDILEAEKIVRTVDAIVGYNKGVEVFAIRGITDFSLFELLDGAEFDPDPEQEKEQRIADLEAAIAAIIGGAM